jgi:hypothetical protein
LNSATEIHSKGSNSSALLSFRANGVHHADQHLMLQKLAQENGQRKRGRPRKRGQRTPEGQQRQIAARISNGVHFQSPILPNGVESQADWDAHLAHLEESLQPVGAWEKLCVYRIALSAWKHSRLVRHETAIVAAAICSPSNEFKSSYDADYVSPEVVAEVLRQSEDSFREELFPVQTLMEKVRGLASDDFSDITFTAAERRQVLSEIIQRSDCGGDSEEGGQDAGELADNVADTTGHDGEDTNDEVAENEDPVIVTAAQLREEVEQIATAQGSTTKEAIEVFVDTLANWIKKRQHRLQLARTHIGTCLIPDERNVNRLALYERQLDAASRRYLNDLYRAQALRLGQPVVAPIAVDVNVAEEHGNGLH